MISADQISLVTVTYSDRLDTLLPVLDAVLKQGVRRAVIFGNGIAGPVRTRLLSFAHDRGIALDLPGSDLNSGSAPGYARALAAAFAQIDVAAVWMLDDDNIPAPDCLEQLLTAMETTKAAAVSALRTDRRYLVAVAEAGDANAMILRPGQVFNFDVRALVERIFFKLHLKTRLLPVPAASAAIAIPRAPYGGILLPKQTYLDVGGPNESFVLYADDLEFSERLAAAPGALLLIPGAKVSDAEQSWNMPAKRQWAATRLSQAKPDFRLFYAVRNAVYLDVRRHGVSPWLIINGLFFLASVIGTALIRGRIRNAIALSRAFADGVAGRLGLNPRYPLPGGAGN